MRRKEDDERYLTVCFHIKLPLKGKSRIKPGRRNRE
jgi:hypothetical protein